MQRAIKKYGKDSFSKEILFSFDNEEEMNSKEKELVDEEYLKRDDIYNLCPGGQGGFGYINKNGLKTKDYEFFLNWRKNCDIVMIERYGEKWRSILVKKSHATLKKKLIEDLEFKINFTEKVRKNALKASAAAKSEKSKIKRAETQKKINHQQGSKNSQFGTCWITNGIENKKIKKEDLYLWLEQGYTKGYPRLKK